MSIQRKNISQVLHGVVALFMVKGQFFSFMINSTIEKYLSYFLSDKNNAKFKFPEPC